MNCFSHAGDSWLRLYSLYGWSVNVNMGHGWNGDRGKSKYRIFSNLIRTIFFADFLNEKKLVRGSNPHFPSTALCLQGRLIE